MRDERVKFQVKKFHKLLTSGHEIKLCSRERNLDWRLVRIFRQFLHQFFPRTFGTQRYSMSRGSCLGEVCKKRLFNFSLLIDTRSNHLTERQMTSYCPLGWFIFTLISKVNYLNIYSWLFFSYGLVSNG